MHLYALTLQKPGAITAAAYGSFSAPRTNEIAVARGNILELLRTDDAGRIHVHTSVCVFGVIRTLARFRLHGQEFDHVIVGSDSGSLTVLRYDAEREAFVKVALEPFGKSGCRRLTPGQFVATDPRGRAVMVAAVEKQKFAYLMKREGDALSISSPLEAHKSHMIVFDMCGVDVGFENPIFAALELDYSEADADPTGEAAANAAKMLVYYELDLGLNTVSRKWSRETERGANAVLAVPGAGATVVDGPGGVLVLAENWVIYEHSTQPAVRTPLPRRADMPDSRGLLITAHATHRQKPGVFFFLLQSELGDLYKVTLDYDAATGRVNDVIVAYFDTIPPAGALCITRSGLLFAASELGDHYLYNIRSLGEGDDAAVAHAIRVDASAEEQTLEITVPVFTPRVLTNIEKIDSLASLAPVLDMRAVVPSAVPLPAYGSAASSAALAAVGASPYFAALCGRGPRSTLRVLREGLGVTEIAVTQMPGKPMAVFALKATNAVADGGDAAVAAPPPDRYIVISFIDATIVFSVGETIEEIDAKEIGFVNTASTLAAQLMADDSFLQVYPSAMRHAHGGATKRVTEWRAPSKRAIVKAAANARQAVIALSGGEVIYFELDDTGMLMEREKKSFGTEITALTLAPIPEGRLRASHCALADAGNMVRVFSLDPAAPLTPVSSSALKASAESLAIVPVRVHGADATMHLFIGLSNGILTRVALDATTGVLSDPRSRFLGLRGVRSTPVTIAGQPACLSLSTRPWLSYSYQGKFFVSPLAYETLESAAGFASDVVPEGIVAIAGNTLRIFALERLGETFTTKTLPLRYTPRRMALLPHSSTAVIIESDHNAFSAEERAAIAKMHAEASGSPAPSADSALPDGYADVADPQAEGIDVRRVGPPLPAEVGKWASAVRVVDIDAVTSSEEAAIASPSHPATHALLELSDNEAAVSVSTATFHDHEGEQYVLVGTVRGLTHHPRAFHSAYVYVFKVTEVEAPAAHAATSAAEATASDAAASSTRRVTSLQLLHKTQVEEIPYAIAPFMGRVLVGVGGVLRLYDLGKKKLLRKTEARGFPTFITNIQTSLDRIFVGDAAESVHFVKYKRTENVLAVFADDFIPRHVTSLLPLDHDTVAVADKFGNVCVLRVPADVSDDVDNPTGNRLLWDAAVLNGAPNKVDLIAQYYVGEVVTCLVKAAMAGGAECIFYSTVMGSIGALLPFGAKEDVDFFTHLELFLRNEGPSLVGRDHVSYRSYFMPVKVRAAPSGNMKMGTPRTSRRLMIVQDVVDGDLCQTFASLPAAKQRSIAEDLERTPAEVLKKLEDLRNKIL